VPYTTNWPTTSKTLGATTDPPCYVSQSQCIASAPGGYWNTPDNSGCISLKKEYPAARDFWSQLGKTNNAMFVLEFMTGVDACGTMAEAQIRSESY